MKIIIALLSSLQLYALTFEQVEQIAKQYTKSYSTIAKICVVESSLGVNKIGDKGQANGLMQLHISTVRFIAKRDKSLAWLNRLDNKTIKRVILNCDHVSIEIASKLFNYYHHRYGYKMAVIRYNGLWKIDRRGHAVRNKHGQKILNESYFNRVHKIKRK